MIIVIFLMTLSSALGMLTPRILMDVLDIYIPNGDIKGIVLLSLVMLAIYFVISLILRMKISVTSRLGQNMIHKIRSDIFEHLQELPFSYYDDSGKSR